MGKVITIKDVAAKANVSISTVSYVINNKQKIGEDVTQRVMRAIDELGYRPNRAARNLVSNCCEQIGIYAASLESLRSSILFNELIASILEEIAGTKYNLVIKVSENQAGFLMSHPSSEVDGAILLCPTNDEAFSDQIIHSAIPVVLIGRPEKNADLINFIDNDNVAISYHMTKHLLQLGHTNIVLLAGPKNYTVSMDRMRGYKMALNEHQLALSSEKILFGDYGIVDDLAFVRGMIQNEGATAILAADDTLAVSAVNTVFSIGLSVPNDVSVICLSETYFSQHYRPKITGVYPNTNELGKKAARKLINLIDKRLIRASNSIIEYTVNIRESCATAKRSSSKG